MPQGWFVGVENEIGQISSQQSGLGLQRTFRKWGLAPELGGRWPKPGAYVQYREVSDPNKGEYITDVRVITAPQPLPTGRQVNVYTDKPGQAPGLNRIERDGSGREPLESALAREEAEARK